MNIQELIYKYGFTDAFLNMALIRAYSQEADCEKCPLRKECFVAFDGIDPCEQYLLSKLEGLQ